MLRVIFEAAAADLKCERATNPRARITDSALEPTSTGQYKMNGGDSKQNWTEQVPERPS